MARLCAEPGCHRDAYESKPKPGKPIIKTTRCNPCRLKREKEMDLVAWAFRKLRSNCKRRRNAAPEWKKSCYDFTITLEYFRGYAARADVRLGGGRWTESCTVDRIREELGYSPGNLRPLSNRENVQKEHARKKGKIFDWELARRRTLSAYSCEEEAREDEGVSEFRFVDETPPTAPAVDFDEAPY